MKFPLSTIDKTNYLLNISSLLEEDDCEIFIDTNIFGLFYKIYSSARKELFDWIQPLIIKGRIRTPLWAINEYSNRFIRNQLDDYFTPLKKLNTTKKEFREISSFLKMTIDENSLLGTAYNTVADYITDLTDVEQKLRKISAAAKLKDQNYKNSVHLEIKNVFEQTVIQSDLKQIFDLVSSNGHTRYHHKFPPGFEDEKKDLNLFGDLIIWNEILESFKKTKKKKGILITNDNKKDWVYAPSNIIENGKEIPNQHPQFKIVDPRLIYEFKQVSNSEEFHIINFESLTQILINKSNGGFIELAKALQIATSKIYEQEYDANTEQLENADETAAKVKEIESKENVNKDSQIYSSYALADCDFPVVDASFASEIIVSLKSYNWYVQNSALDKLSDYDVSGVERTQNFIDKLFVIGRNINQAACGGSSKAVNIMQNLSGFLFKYDHFVMNHIYSGMLYEVYFNSKNDFREEHFKATFINELLNLQDKPQLSDSIQFINKTLESYKDKLFIVPSHEPYIVKLLISYEEQEDLSLDWLGITGKYHRITDIVINQTSVITEDESIAIDGYYNLSGSEEEVIGTLSIIYLIPKKQMQLMLTPEKNERITLKLEGSLKLRKLPQGNSATTASAKW